ncbi:MAG TPA: sarcosine oxidase subunit gamma family protein [Thiolinea sp.]|nr:sarcosine oxidase subunit gamma family protein [Thiolinea sp.]
MSDYRLQARSPLGAYTQRINGIRLRELNGRALVLISAAQQEQAALAQALRQAFALSLPAVGDSCSNADGSLRLLGLQQDRFGLLLEDGPVYPERRVAGVLGGAFGVVDQSDAWVMLELAGVSVPAVLARLCMLDLDLREFPPGRVARTVMEHMTVIILRTGEQQFLLLSPRSLARSFLHALETSAHNAG